MQFHVAIADNVPGSPSGEYTVTAGQTATFTIDSPGPDDLYAEGTAVPLLNGGYVRWAYVDSVLPNSLTVTLESARERSGRRIHTGCEPLRLLLQYLRTRRRQWRYLRSRGTA